MKILILTPQFFPTMGGVPVLTDLIANALRAQDHDVQIIVSESSNAAKRVETEQVVYRPNFLKLIRMLTKADAILCVQDVIRLTWPIGIGLVRRMPVFFLQMHPSRGVGVKAFLKDSFRRRLFRIGSVCACSKYIANFVENSYGINVSVVPNPYDSNIFFCDASEAREIDILFVGRLSIHKRCDILIEALAIARDDGYHPKVLICGEGPEESRLKEMIFAAALDNCKFSGAGTQEQVADLMRRAKVLVVPSGYEPFGIVVLEGLASGCTVVTSDAGGLLEAGGGIARTFRVNDATSLANELLKLSRQPENREALSSEVVLHLKAHTPAMVAQELLKFSLGESASARLNH